MSGFHDVYVLAKDRTSETVNRFLNRFVPNREESAEEYPIPQNADRIDREFRLATEVVEYCVINLRVPYSLYWRNRDSSEPAHAMMFFTIDGALILGLSVTSDAEKWLITLLEFANSEVGISMFEESPPLTAAEFRARATAL